MAVVYYLDILSRNFASNGSDLGHIGLHCKSVSQSVSNNVFVKQSEPIHKDMDKQHWSQMV